MSKVRDNEPGPATGTRARPPYVLVVDDIDDNRDLYVSYFKYAGVEVDEACNGEEALTKVAQRQPDLIVMDLAMPRVDGWEATRLVKSNPRTKHIIVLVVTGYASKEDLTRARAAGADDVCTKPCSPKELFEKAQALLARGKARNA